MILCLGTTPAVQRTMIFQRVVLDGVNRAEETRVSAAGKSINVALVLQTLGQPVLATGFVGGDTGTLIRDQLSQRGIAHDFVAVGLPTRTRTTVIDRAAGTATELVEENAAVSPADYDALLAILEKHLGKAKYLVFSGALPQGAPPDFYRRCIDQANARRIPALLDTRGQPLKHALTARPMLVKCNRQELEETVGHEIKDDSSLGAALMQLTAAGPRWAVVTRGGEPALACDGQSIWRIAPPAIKAVSPVGSGDAFAAGLVAGLVQGQAMPEAFALASACGAANALVPVAGVVDLKDIAALQPMVKIVQIK